MSITELLPEISALPHAEKFRLAQLLLEQLAKEDGVELKPSSDRKFNPREFFGAGQSTKQEIDDYLQDTRKGWQ